MTDVTLDSGAQVCYNGGMDPKYCICNCGETTKGGDFLPGHDARYKSALITSAIGGNEEAKMILEVRGWTKFLEKRIAAKDKTAPREKDSAEVSGDGLPANATRPGDLDEEAFVKAICSGRLVVIRRQVKGLDIEDQLRFRNPYERTERVDGGNTYRKVAIRPSKPVLTDGELRLHEEETGGCRTIRLADVVGVLKR